MFAPDTKLVLSMRRRTFVRGDFLWAFTFLRGIASKFAIYEGSVLGLVGHEQEETWRNVDTTRSSRVEAARRSRTQKPEFKAAKRQNTRHRPDTPPLDYNNTVARRLDGSEQYFLGCMSLIPNRRDLFSLVHTRCEIVVAYRGQ